VSIDILKSTVFSMQMPDMPARLREIWQAAFMLRRKYSNPTGAPEDAEQFFSDAWSDALAVANAFGNSETVQQLMVEVYSDIERQWKVVQARLEQAQAG